MAAIGFHGSAIKVKKGILPATQILLGGGVVGDGAGRVSDKIVKIPSKRAPLALKTILNDYEAHANEGEYHIDYYQRQGKPYFYELLKSLASTDNLVDSDFIDWGHEETFKTEIGVGECAGVTIDLVATLLLESEERLAEATEALAGSSYSDSIYHTYSALVNTAKALLVSEGLKTNTQAAIIKDFDEKYPEKGHFSLEKSFQETVYAMNENKPTKDFAQSYLTLSKQFVRDAFVLREKKDEQSSNSR
jgi:sulfite reductase (ferredoxin)